MNNKVFPKSRIVLKVEFIEKYSIKLTLIYIDEKFRAKNDETLIYKSKDNGFYLYSRKSFILGHNSIRFPDNNNYKKSNIYIKKFFNDEQRYNFLKKLKNSLIDWNNNYVNFIQTNDHILRRKNIIYSDNLWIL